MIPAYNKMRCAAFPFETGIHFRRKTDFFPEEDTTKSYSGFEPEPTRLQAEGHSQHTGWANLNQLDNNFKNEQTITDKNIDEILGTAYFKAATVGNAVKGFKECGIKPHNPRVQRIWLCCCAKTTDHDVVCNATENNSANPQTLCCHLAPRTKSSCPSTRARINHNSSIFTAEALDDLTVSNKNPLILSDSLSVLHALQNYSIKSHSVIHRLASEIYIQSYYTNKLILLWTPGYYNILWNEQADYLARSVTESNVYIDWIASENISKKYIKKDLKKQMIIFIQESILKIWATLQTLASSLNGQTIEEKKFYALEFLAK
ncbi:RNase H domain-containing protein [Trichonephila clavipes]|nr:RNase H domain-containing protein [Trichonephila clavipes]